MTSPPPRVAKDDPTATGPLSATDGGVLLVGHGTRQAVGQREFLALADLVAERLAPLPVEPCFLELAAPSIAAGWQRLFDRGARRVVVSPTLLFAAGHANHDIPDAVAEACDAVAARAGETVVWRQAAPLDSHPAIVELSLRREREALAGKADVPPESCGRLLVGRGSGDSRAVDAFRDFAARRREAGGARSLDIGFLAIAQPRASEALERIGQAGWTRVIVAPHLLFAGQLILDLETSVERVAARFPRIEWIVADRLGPDAAVCAALCDRVAETAFGRAWGLRSGTGAGSDGDACAAMSLAADLASRGSSG